MKAYVDFMQEISGDELYEGLLGFGMFSAKLPPVFSAETFFDYCKMHNPSFAKKPYEFVRYGSMRNTNIIRELGIPTPMAYQQLCNCLKENWQQIVEYFAQHTSNQSHIVSRLHIRKIDGTSELFKMNYENWKEDGSPEQDLLIGSKYIVHADISKCFPGIYSHSIPWALVGKAYSKTKEGRNENQWQNKLDSFTRNCKYGETHGLLIGPHASNLLGEIILTRIDDVLVGEDWKYVRYIDDYTCYVDSFEEAKKFLVELSVELKKYDLLLNDKKTEISKLPVALTEQWIAQLEKTDAFLRNGRFDYRSAKAYFDRAIDLTNANKENAAILNYAIKALPIEKMSEQAQTMCVKMAFHLCLLYPYLVQVFDEFVFEKYHVGKNEMARFSNLLFEQELKVKNYDAVCYALFFAIKYDFGIQNLSAQDAVDSDSCIYKLLAYWHFAKNKKTSEKKVLREHACALKKNDADLESNWLFVYETLPQSELPNDWKNLKKAGISFLKPDYSIPSKSS